MSERNDAFDQMVLACATGKCPKCKATIEASVKLFLAIPGEMIYKLSKQAIRSRKVNLQGVDWDNMRLFCPKCGWGVRLDARKGEVEPMGQARLFPETPRRIQRSRAKGWKMPVNAVYVGRPTKWGNPFKPDDFIQPGQPIGVRGALKAFAEWVRLGHDTPELLEEYLGPLRGKDLVCWCKPGAPCHADILIRLANKPLPKDEADDDGS